MTNPVTTPANSNPSSDAFVAGTQEIVKQAQRLGISWSITPATVTIPGTSSTTVIVDGDSVASNATNITNQPLFNRQRVYVLLTPPAGNFIIGFVPSSTTDSSTTYLAAQTNSASVGTGFTLIYSIPFAPQEDRVYSVKIGNRAKTSASTNVIEFGINWKPVNGVEVALWYPGAFGPSGAVPDIAVHSEGFIINYALAKTGNIYVYIRADAGTAIWTGNAVFPRYFQITQAPGRAEQYPGAINWP